ncbi:MFS transporter [Paraburkholderia sediminicola]|uniref:MFS transporter n=1 Tax=Paraburkholderia sediminicola TaxID=458836 RepID=UPI0038BA2D02
MYNHTESEVLKKIGCRILPFLAVCFFIAYLDRVNVGFAAITMNADLKLSASAFGLGAGLFFFGYFILEIPSNLLLAKFGARKWLARIMVSWGLISASMIFVRGEIPFYVLRFALGVAEAGFFPGVIFYMTAWFPESFRGRAIAWFMLAAPLSSLLGSPLSGLLLALDGTWGLRGWQLLFVVEALPAVLLGIATWFYLSDRPRDASWLTSSETDWIERVLKEESNPRLQGNRASVWSVLVDPRIWALTLVGFSFIAGMIGLSLWLPQIVKSFGLSIRQTGLVTAIPYLIAAAGMVWWGRHSDKSGDRAWHVALSGLLACVGLVVAALVKSPAISVAMLSLAALGLFSGAPPFWSWASSTFSGTAAAAGIALINSFANLGGFFGPALFGWFRHTTGSFTYSLVMLGLFPLMGALLAIALSFTGGRGAVLPRVSESG